MFRFRLDPVLRVRRLRRDRVRETLATALAEREALAARERDHADRTAQTRTALRDAAAPGTLDVALSIDLRVHLGTLRSERDDLDRFVALAEEQLAACRRLLADADRDVRVLESLRDRRRDEHARAETRREDREATDLWTAARAFAREPSADDSSARRTSSRRHSAPEGSAPEPSTPEPHGTAR